MEIRNKKKKNIQKIYNGKKLTNFVSTRTNAIRTIVNVSSRVQSKEASFKVIANVGYVSKVVCFSLGRLSIFLQRLPPLELDIDEKS